MRAQIQVTLKVVTAKKGWNKKYYLLFGRFDDSQLFGGSVEARVLNGGRDLLRSGGRITGFTATDGLNRTRASVLVL